MVIVVAIAAAVVPKLGARDKTMIAAVDDLHDRSDKMCAALKAKDARALYDLRTPEFRGCTEYEKWLQDFNASGAGQVVTCKSTRFQAAERSEIENLKSQCSSDHITVEDAAVVNLRIKLVRPNGRSEVINDMLNGWVRVGGEWYWYDWASPSID